MKILVTGGAGYIGSILIPELLNKNYTVTVLDNFIYEQTSLIDFCIYDNLNIIRGDVRNKGLIKDLVEKNDLIIPLACIVGAPACDKEPFTARSVNVRAIDLILKYRSRNQPIIFPTTNSGYGTAQEGLYCTEETPLRPISLYGRLKVEAEKRVLDSGESITLRLATAFGLSPRMRLDLLVNDFVYRAITDRFIVLFEAHFKRNYIHVRDVAKAFIHCINNFEKLKNEPYNVGLSDANLSKLELCEKIKEHIPDFHIFTSEIGKDPDKRNYIVSNEKIEKTGYRAKISLDKGIGELKKGYTILRKKYLTNI